MERSRRCSDVHDPPLSYGCRVLFNMRTTETADGTLVTLVGDVDLATMPEVSAGLSGISGHTTIDLSGVDYFDPVCMGVLIAADLKARRSGGRLNVTASSAVFDLLAESRLVEILEVSAPPD